MEKAIPSRTTMPILKGVLLHAENGALQLVSHNLELSVQARYDQAEIEAEGKIVLPEKIVEIIRQFESGTTVTIKVQEDGLRAEITSGSAVFVLYGMDAAEYPRYTVAEEWSAWEKIEFSAAAFKELFKKIIIAVSHDEARPLFRAVHLRLEKSGKLTAVATDTYRLARVQQFYREERRAKDLDFLVPGRTLAEILKVVEENPEEKVVCYFQENEIIFCYREFSFTSRLLEGKYPDVSGVFPAEFKTAIKVNKEKLEKLLRRAILLASGQNHVIILNIYGDILHVSAGSESGKMDEELVLEEKEGEDLEEILLNARYFMEPLPVIDDEILHIYFHGPLGPCIFSHDMVKVEGKETYAYLVLPIKTDRRA